MAGKARQWQHAGSNAGKRDAVGLLRSGLPAAIAFVRDVLVHRTLREGCAVGVALVPDLLPVLPC
jgi:hypothetical protein